MAAANTRGDQFIGVEHLLAALVAQREGAAPRRCDAMA